MDKTFAVKSKTADTFLGLYGIGSSLAYQVPAWSYGFTRDEADQLAAAHDGVVTTRPAFDATVGRYTWSAVAAPARVLTFPTR